MKMELALIAVTGWNLCESEPSHRLLLSPNLHHIKYNIKFKQIRSCVICDEHEKKG